MEIFGLSSPNIGKYRELKKYTEKYWKSDNFINLKNLIMISKKIKLEKIFTQINNNFKYIHFGDFSLYDSILDISCTINCIKNNNAINIKKYFSYARGGTGIEPNKMTKYFNLNYHYIIPNNFDNLKLVNKFLFIDIINVLKIGILPTICILSPISYLYLSINKKNNFLSIFEVYILLIKKIKNLGIKSFCFEEPILCSSINTNWKKLFFVFYKKIHNYIEITINSCFECNTNNKEIFNNIKCNFINCFDKNKLNTRISNAIESDLNKTNVFIKFDKLKTNTIIILNNLNNIPYNISIEKFKNKKYLSFYFQKINELVFLKNIINKNINSYDLLYLSNFKIYKEKILIETNFNEVKKKRNKLNKKLLLSNTIGSFPQNKEIKISRKYKKFFLINNIEYSNILKENIYLCLLKQINFEYKILVHGEFERNDMVEYFAENIKGINITKNGWVQSYGTRYVKPPIILNINNSKNITEDWLLFSKSVTKKKIKIILSGPITILKWSFFNNKVKFLICLKLSELIKLEIFKLQKNGFNIFQIDEPTIKECLPINKKYWKCSINNYLFCFNNCTKFIKSNNEIHSHVCYSIFNDIIDFISKMNIDVLTIESTREKFDNLVVFYNNKLNLGAGIYDVHSPLIPYKQYIKNNFFIFLTRINPIKSWINPDCGLKTRNWFELNYSLNMINNILSKIKNIFF
ncbi:hypothetical protein [Candidatus Carsonella ruddii]|uniref:5-methyltetrahydropteroyltriglutamate--homocysteine S-methyltransferase n=1 Tax=Candidatus Carsonella ruddii (Diaphorina cf. continua) TaxID=2661587 RepID=A0A7R6VZY7_CARRU|nr:hypothetical protein [Candidatus Carsonella ruddii (Diaphorina cf. continua)]BCG49242.1 5-methyltetrahydropteroyltriglutamate--homocystei ne S-methyltransferase [Candidatus Carsonella ruddii (Diaphorina cf. continua)]